MRISTGAATRWRTARRRGLVALAVTALTAGVLAVGAGPAAASATSGPGGTLNAGEVTGQFTSDGAGGASISPSASTPGVPDTSTVTLGSNRTLLTMGSLNLEPADELELVVASRSDVVLIRVDSGAAVIDGALQVTVGSSVGSFGGNVWIWAPGGVVFGPNARVDSGGLLATTGAITTADFFDGDATFSFADAPGGPVTADVLLQTGSRISGHGGLVALAAPSVQQMGGSVVNDLSQGTDSDALLAAADVFSLSLAGDPDGDQDLTSYAVPPGGQTAAVAPLSVGGTVRAGNVYLASDSSAGRPGPVVDAGATIDAAGAAASGDGVLIAVSGGGVTAGPPVAVPPVAAIAVPRSGAAAQPVLVHGSLTGSRAMVLSSGDLTFGSAGALSAGDIVMATGGTYRNSGSVTAPGGRFLVYAPRYTDVSGGPDSGVTAIWNATMASRPPSSITGSRYVFQYPPDLVFRARDLTKAFSETAALTVDAPPTQPPGVTGSFSPDAGPAYTGTPALTSAGAAANTKVPRGGTFPITTGIGSLTSALGYRIVLQDGVLTVTDPTAPVVTHTTTGTAGANGWYTGPVTVDWTASDPESDWLDLSGCADTTVTAEQARSVLPCSAESAGGSTSDDVTVGVDTTAPELTITGRVGSAAYVPGTPSAQPVVLDFECTDGTSAVDPASVPADGRTVSTTTLVDESCRDMAGNVGRAQFQVVVDVPVTVTAVFDRPIDPAPVMNIAKLGRVLPVKATVTSGAEPVTGPSSQPVHLSVSSGLSCTVGSTSDAIESYAAGSSDVGNLLRWDATAQRWTYNLDTSAFAMKANGCYRVSVHYGGTVTGDRATGGVLAGYFFVQTKK